MLIVVCVSRCISGLLTYHVLVGPANVCKERYKLALLSEEGWREGRVHRIQLLGVGTDIVTQLVEEGHHLLKVGVVALCQVLCVGVCMLGRVQWGTTGEAHGVMDTI